MHSSDTSLEAKREFGITCELGLSPATLPEIKGTNTHAHCAIATVVDIIASQAPATLHRPTLSQPGLSKSVVASCVKTLQEFLATSPPITLRDFADAYLQGDSSRFFDVLGELNPTLWEQHILRGGILSRQDWLR